jgi:DNA-binding CsgD family transcriptional regulator
VFVAALERARHASLGRLEILAGAGLLKTLHDEGHAARIASLGPALLARAVELGQGRYMGAVLAGPLCKALLAIGQREQAQILCDQMAAYDPLPLGLMQVFECQAELAFSSGSSRAAHAVAALRSLPSGPQLATERFAITARLELECLCQQGSPGDAVARALAIKAEQFDWPLLVVAMRAAADAGDPAFRVCLGEIAARRPTSGMLDEANAATFAAESTRLGKPELPLWEKAAGLWQALGHVTRHAYALMRAGAAAAAAGDRKLAASHFATSARLAADARATALLERVNALATRCNVSLGNDAGSGSGSPIRPFGLTGREIEVLRLLAAGRSNREIADSLFISVKTASVHVSNIFGKLGVSTRSAAAALAHRNDLAGEI